MTVKELFFHYTSMNKHLFQNPQNMCLEELKLKYFTDITSYEELIPALDQRWCNKDYVFTLYMPPPSKSSDGKFTMGSKEDWLERIDLFIGDMITLLQMEYHRFWSEVMFNKQFLDGVNSFLQSAPPYYLRDLIPQDKDILQKLRKCQKLVYLVLIRLTTTKESEKSWMKSNTLGNILYDNFIISIPQLMDICSIYAQENFEEVKQLVKHVINIQPKYVCDIEKSIPFISKVFSKLENHLNSFNEENGFLPTIPNQRIITSTIEIVKLILLVLDIGYSLATFLDICPQAGIVFHEQHLETRIASFYENITPELTRLLDSQYNNEETQEEYLKYQFKLNLSRHQLILAAQRCLTSYLSSILEQRSLLSNQEMKDKVDNYLNTVSDCLCYHVFMRDYNSAFPIQKEIRLLYEVCPDIDSVKCDFMIESVLSLYDLPPMKTQQSKDTMPSLGESSSSNNLERKQANSRETIGVKVSGVELESLITEVKDILPHLGDGFIVSCLKFYNFVSADVINAILEGSLPDSLASLDLEMPVIPPEDTEDTNGLPERVNLYDNDEFDIMTQSTIDTSRVHRGKRPEKHKNLSEMLDDKSHVNHLRDVYAKLSLVECLENVNEYEDEYDDTYDDIDAPVGNEGETEAEERRAFVIPRVLQQRKKSWEEPQDFEEGENENESEQIKADLFIENPADIRERAEQRRRDMRGRGSGRSRAAFPRHDVVGKPRGQGQEKEVIQSREFKNTNKASRANHNRRYMSDRKRRQGMIPS